MTRFNYYQALFAIWLFFPATWFLLYHVDNPAIKKKTDTIFYTSVKAPKGSEVSLYNGDGLLIHIDPTGDCFNPLQFQGKLGYSDSFNIRVSGITDRDTISFEAINFFKKNTLFTLEEDQFKYLDIDSAKRCDTLTHQLKFALKKGMNCCTIHLPTPKVWSHPDITAFKFWIIIPLFLTLFLFLFFISPSLKYVAVVTGLSCAFLCFYWWIGKDKVSQLSVRNDTALKGIIIYRDSVPEFVPELCTIHQGMDSTFHTQVNLDLFPYYRISINRGIASIKNYSFSCGYGLLSKNWKLSSVNPSEIITNDMDYISKNKSWTVAGNDPYICLTTAQSITSLLKIQFLRETLFLFISALVFIIAILLQPLLMQLNVPKTLLLLTFFGILFNSLFFRFFNSDKEVLDSEKRKAAQYRDYDSMPFIGYVKNSGLYIQDQLPGRSSFIISNNYIKYKLFGEVPANPLVYFGKHGWLFYIGENTQEMYENRHPLTDAELKQMCNLLVGRNEWLKRRHIHYYIFFPRLSHFVYNEEIGPGLNQYNPTPKLIQLLDYLKKNTDLDIIDVGQPIMDAKAIYKQRLYFKNDSHWTVFGAYFAYAAIINHIRKDFPNMPPPIPFDKIRWGEKDDEDGDLAKLVSLNMVIKRHIYIPVNHRIGDFKKLKTPDYPEFINIYPMLFFASNDTLAPKLIMNRDSYSNALIPFFATNFSRQGYLWTYTFYPTIIEKEKPDIVMLEMSERSIYELLHDTPPQDTVSAVTPAGNGKK